VHQFSGQKLREARKAAGVRPELLAVRVDRCLGSIRLYERGEADPPASIVAALADALEIAPGDLYDVFEAVA
jgi:transcriptional regulator with XRE-family HTH domain